MEYVQVAIIDIEEKTNVLSVIVCGNIKSLKKNLGLKK
jgi:hypothetical protein